MLLIGNFLTAGVNFLIHLFVNDYPVINGPIGLAAGSLAALGFYTFWFRPKFGGFFRGGNIREGFKTAVPYIAYLVFSFILDVFFVPELKFHLITFNGLFTAFAAGLLEETIFRGGILTTLLRSMKDSRRILPAGLISSAVFGVMHMTNLTAGSGMIQTILQSINAAAAGLVDALMYMVSGNILVTMAVHVLHDIIAFSFDNVTEAGVIVGGLTWETWLNFALCTALGIYAFIMLRKPEIQDHILQVWEKKWNADNQTKA